ncbi:MAG: hypothetical protein R3C44_16630 [Chloroflexota bacterium]
MPPIWFCWQGLIAIVYVRSGYVLENIAPGLALMVLQALVILSVTIAGGTRLSAVQWCVGF